MGITYSRKFGRWMGQLLHAMVLGTPILIDAVNPMKQAIERERTTLALWMKTETRKRSIKGCHLYTELASKASGEYSLSLYPTLLLNTSKV